MSVFFLFIDGIGVGPKASHNPLFSGKWDAISYFTNCEGVHEGCAERSDGSTLFRKLDANLGVDGLPQSGTGQVTLFSGENASKLIGKHFGPYPYSKTKPILEQRSLFHKVMALGKSAHFLNAYPDIFFRKSEKRDRWTSTTLMAKSAGIRLNGLDDILKERAVTAEITQTAWREILGLNVPEISPEDASKRVISSLESYDLVLYEYYLTDKAGHERSQEKALRVLSDLNRFIWAILKELDDRDTMVITSDHGNIEDLSIKTHTRNPVPLFVKGDIEPFRKANSIQDVTPAILKVLHSGK
jgi:2,3-bisphosphoglycerate-independent phosphoglycerate mutase